MKPNELNMSATVRNFPTEHLKNPFEIEIVYHEPVCAAEMCV